MPRKRQTNPCRCGCGVMPVSGKFCAGHDVKFLRKLCDKAGGIFELECMVNAMTNRYNDIEVDHAPHK